MIALRKESFELIKKESKYMGLLFLIALAIFQAAFFSESFFAVLRTVLSIFWLFAIPGYFAVLYWGDKINFAERVFIGIALSAAIIGIFSYYLGLAGLNVKYDAILLPSLVIIIGFAAAVLKK